MTPLGVVTGLKFEARVFARAFAGCRGLVVGLESTGGHINTTTAAARLLVESGARLLVSFGLAGALHPALKTGDVVLASSTIFNDQRFHLNPIIRNLIAGGLDGRFKCVEGPVFTSDRVLARIEEKTDAFARSAAIAVDMESGPLVAVAAAADIPALVLRVIADDAKTPLPKAATSGMKADGGIDIGRVLVEMLKSPSEIPDLIAISKKTARARQTLGGVAGLLADLFAD